MAIVYWFNILLLNTLLNVSTKKWKVERRWFWFYTTRLFAVKLWNCRAVWKSGTAVTLWQGNHRSKRALFCGVLSSRNCAQPARALASVEAGGQTGLRQGADLLRHRAYCWKELRKYSQCHALRTRTGGLRRNLRKCQSEPGKKWHLPLKRRRGTSCYRASFILLSRCCGPYPYPISSTFYPLLSPPYLIKECLKGSFLYSIFSIASLSIFSLFPLFFL